MDLVKAFWIMAFIALGIYVISIIVKGEWPDYRKSDWEKKIEEDYQKNKDLNKDTKKDDQLNEDDLPY
jgi:hypothetical protein